MLFSGSCYKSLTFSETKRSVGIGYRFMLKPSVPTNNNVFSVSFENKCFSYQFNCLLIVYKVYVKLAFFIPRVKCKLTHS